MSFREYLHEKAEESRHSETVAYLMFLAGAVFFVGGILVTLSLTGDVHWLLFIPYHAESYIGSVLGLALIVCGCSLTVLGIVAGIHYSRDRGWYIRELHKANSLEDVLLHAKSAKNVCKKKEKV